MSRVSWSTALELDEGRRLDDDDDDDGAMVEADAAAAVAAAEVEDVELALDFRPWDLEGRPDEEVGPMAGL